MSGRDWRAFDAALRAARAREDMEACLLSVPSDELALYNLRPPSVPALKMGVLALLVSTYDIEVRSHAQPRAATRSHTQPRAATRSHAKPCEAMRSHAQPCLACAATKEKEEKKKY